MCSNNYVAAALTQCRLYYEATGDDQFAELEAALRDGSSAVTRGHIYDLRPAGGRWLPSLPTLSQWHSILV